MHKLSSIEWRFLVAKQLIEILNNLRSSICPCFSKIFTDGKAGTD
jgi:hypothetical protein